MPKLHPLIKLNKDVAEQAFGHAPGRPTISRRAGTRIGRALGIGTDAATDLFHFGLFAAGLWLASRQGK